MREMFQNSQKAREYFVKYIKLGNWTNKFRSSPCDIPRLMASFENKAEAFLKINEQFPLWERNQSFHSVSTTTNDSDKVPRTSSSSSISVSKRDLGESLNKPLCSPNKSHVKLNKVDSFFKDKGSVSSLLPGGALSPSAVSFRESYKESSFSMEEMVPLMLAILFRLYLDSNVYKSFKSFYGTQQPSSVSVASPAPISTPLGRVVSFSIDSMEFMSESIEWPHDSRPATLPSPSSHCSNSHVQQLLLGAAAFYDESHLVDILSTPWWCDSVRQTIDQTHISITVAAADNEEEGFPLVYANAAFEKLTGYGRAESLGRNLSFLQGPDTDSAEVDRLCEALKRQVPVVAQLVNYRKNGKAFHTLVTLVPVFDELGIFKYVVGVQYDLGAAVKKGTVSSVADDARLIGDFLSLLPYILQ